VENVKMESKITEKIRLLILTLIFVIATISVIIAYIVFNVNSIKNQEINSLNEKVPIKKETEDVLLEKNEIIQGDEISKLTSKVTNNGDVKENLRFKAKIIGNDGTVICEAIGYVGKIKAYETKYINSYITTDISNFGGVTYEIIK